MISANTATVIVLIPLIVLVALLAYLVREEGKGRYKIPLWLFILITSIMVALLGLLKFIVKSWDK